MGSEARGSLEEFAGTLMTAAMCHYASLTHFDLSKEVTGRQLKHSNWSSL